MGKYTEDSRELLELVGGKENIAAVSHCMTRMRFVLGDPKKADIKRIEAMKAVKGSFTQAGQFQVIIGNTVAEFYKDFMDVAGIEGVSMDAVKQAAQRNQNILQRAAAIAAEIFAPLIPAIITGGLILGFRNCIDQLYLFENGTKTLVELSQFWAGVDHFLWLIGEAVFHVGIPVGICWSVVRKMGGTPILGIILGLTLVSGQLLNAYAVATTPIDKIPHWDFGYFTVDMIGYQAQVLPAILAAFTLVYLERFFKRLVPSVVQMLSNGVEILLHVGIDTVDMQGDGFSYLVHTGDEVKAGTPLLTFSREKIKAAGHPDVTICVITNKNGVESFAFHTGMVGKTGETVIASY